jgi:gluconokinase
MPPQDPNSAQNNSSKGSIPLFIVGGPAGCGKTTIAQAIANSLHFPFIEGDDLHPAQNIAKMSSGHPLVDADRWDWLDKIIDTALGVAERESRGIVITCSALKKSYRDRMRRRVQEANDRMDTSRSDEDGNEKDKETIDKRGNLELWFVFCSLSQEESLRRVRDRPGHYMKAGMVASQFADLEVPDEMEEERVYVLNVERSIPEVNQDAIAFVKRSV